MGMVKGKMNISFYMEFPEEEMGKLRLVDFPVKVYIAARSLEEFRDFERQAKNISPEVETAYWPILEKTYWISPFSYNKELDNLHEDLGKNKEKLEVLIDLELPKFWLHLILYNLPSVIANAIKYHLRIRKPRIRKLFEERERYNIEITTTSYPATSKHYLLNYITFKLMGFLGVHFNPKVYDHKVIFMCHSSIRKDLLEKTLKNIKSRSPKTREKYQISLGMLDYGMLMKTGFIKHLQKLGILKKLHLLTPKDLDRELSLAKDYGVRDVTIYCIGGIDEKLIEVIKRHV